MMIVNSTTPAGSGGTERSSSLSSLDMNYDAFLQLLISSMKNQDPTKPNDPDQMMSQLASFAGVEQTIKLNNKLDSLLSVSGGGQAAALVGKTIESLDGATKGIVSSVVVSAGNFSATLADGTKFDLGNGFKVSAS
jgi:flagellar basal-body rod modification protein FlgD